MSKNFQKKVFQEKFCGKEKNNLLEYSERCVFQNEIFKIN